MALNSLFFERVLAEVGRVTKKMEEHGDINLEALSYQEGKAFLCFQIYRQNIRNPRLLEIAEKRLADIKALKEVYAKQNEVQEEIIDETGDDELVPVIEVVTTNTDSLELEIEGTDAEDVIHDDVSGDEIVEDIETAKDDESVEIVETNEVVTEVSVTDIITPVETEETKIKQLTAEEINLMKSNELKVEVNLRGIILEKYTVEPMREALLELIK